MKQMLAQQTVSHVWSNIIYIMLFQLSTLNIVELSAFYDPNLLHDHWGDYFKHVHAKLVQLDICDDDDVLIPPWNIVDKLRPGTVILIDASLVCWHIFTKGRGDKLDRKVSSSLSILINIACFLYI